MPDWLLPEARLKWEEVTHELHELGVIATIDATALSMFCQTWAHYRTLEDHVARYGPTYLIESDEGNYTMLRPEIRQLDRMREFLLRACAEFGLTPSSRTRLSVARKPKKDELEKFLAG